MKTGQKFKKPAMPGQVPDEIQEALIEQAREKHAYLQELRVSDNEELNDLIADIDVMYPKVARALMILVEEKK